MAEEQCDEVVCCSRAWVSADGRAHLDQHQRGCVKEGLGVFLPISIRASAFLGRGGKQDFPVCHASDLLYVPPTG